MRTATTVAKTHAGNWVLVANPDVPLVEQERAWRGLVIQQAKTKTHKEFAFVQIQETDSTEPARQLRFSPEIKTKK